jgi:hypothetical protein
MNKEQLEKLQEQFNKIWEKPEFQALLPQMPRYRYWQLTSKDFKRLGYTGKKFIDRFAFAYTTERTNDNFFWAIVYRIKKTKQGEHWHMTRKTHRRQRQKAKAIALKWYYQRREVLKKRLTLQGKIKAETDEEWKQRMEAENKKNVQGES